MKRLNFHHYGFWSARLFALVWFVNALVAYVPLHVLAQQISEAQANSITPPKDPRAFREPDLVELIKLDPTIRLDIRYAKSNNFVGRPVYKEERAFLQRPAAEALVRVHQSLKKYGYGLLIFDGYRPWRVTKLFWDITPAPLKKFVANPKDGSRHNRGCAVDLSLYDLATGKEVPMPSEYDEMTERAHSEYSGGTPEQRRVRDLLRAEMEKQGFTVFPIEWWHFDYKDWHTYPILDIDFSEIK
ncbi:MAG: M15 family metallopeptidase [Bacteroidota bacterium]|nr:M15 family metallopeptidase [Candidatus Kapabacteria bacterium]MDW8220258.1 M15 family metallopeptidase [Bacteroidota bacterium]